MRRLAGRRLAGVEGTTGLATCRLHGARIALRLGPLASTIRAALGRRSTR
jgi:hypothetical protein